jgi:hypothetical protein
MEAARIPKGRNQSMTRTLLACLFCVNAVAADEPWPILSKVDFENADRGPLKFSDPKAFGFVDRDAGKALANVGKSSFKPKHRSPLLYALLEKPVVEDFQLDLSMKSTTRDYGHRDLCLFFGFQDPNHFYYVHLAKAADPHAHSVFLVNGADRVSIAKDRTKGVEWGDAWRKVRLVRKSPKIEVYFDDMTKPVMSASDAAFKWGKVGVGSFDDAGLFDDLVLRGVPRKPDAR